MHFQLMGQIHLVLSGTNGTKAGARQGSTHADNGRLLLGPEYLPGFCASNSFRTMVTQGSQL